MCVGCLPVSLRDVQRTPVAGISGVSFPSCLRWLKKVGRTTTLVLLPGLDGTEVFFKPLLAALPKWIKPVVVTYPTSGANHYSDLLTVVQAAVEDSKEFYVLGWSFSGPLALMLAAKERSKVRGVILCASFIRPPLPGLSWLRFAITSPVVHCVRLMRRTTVAVLTTAQRIYCAATRQQRWRVFLAESSRAALRPFSRSMHGVACAGARGPCSIWPARETRLFLDGMLRRWSENFHQQRS